MVNTINTGNVAEYNKPAADQAILEASIAGERIIAVIRLFLLIPITLFMLSIAFINLTQHGYRFMLSDPALYIELLGIGVMAALSLWILKITKEKKYYNWIKYLVPLLEVLLLTWVNVAVATQNQKNLLITGAVVFLYLVFLVLNSLRNSPVSVILTGFYVMVAYGSCAFFGLAELRFFHTGGEYFSNSAGGVVRLAVDDEIIKLFIIAILTGLLAFSARRFNNTLRGQTTLLVERENLRQTLVARLKEVTQNILTASQKLFNTTEHFTEDIGQLIDSSQKIGAETENEFTNIEQTTAYVLDLLNSINGVAEHIKEQAGLVQESASAIEELNGSINVITKTAQQANNLAGSLAGKAHENVEWVNQVVNAVRDTEQASATISEIVELISTMASTTGLLAMNAAIEAAHAGETGKGFAVIADEIARLADTVSENASEINGILQNISERIAGIVLLTDKAQSGLQELLTGVEQTKDINREILNAMEEESNGVREILGSTQKLSLLTRDVTDASSSQANRSKEIISAVEQMKSQANNVYSHLEKQKEKCNAVNSSTGSLQQVINVNKEIIDKLEQLVSRL